MGHKVIREVARVEHGKFDLVVEGQLTDGHEDGTGRGGGSPGKEPAEAFLPVDPHNPIQGVLVAGGQMTQMNEQDVKMIKDGIVLILLSPLFRRKFDVVLHPDVDHVSRSPYEAAKGTRQARDEDLLVERDAVGIAPTNVLLGHLWMNDEFSS